MITDLIQIRRLGEKKRDENFKFRVFLKTHDYPERRFRRIAEEIEGEIDCTACANCCKVATVVLKERDVEKLARYLRITPQQFLAEYTVRDEDNDLILRRTEAGCVFLDGNLCTIYEARPSACTTFPHLVRGDGPISTRMWQFVDRACYCPIVYNALEAYKDEVRFRRR
jgi:Fe-S-cluster containining protein